MENKRIFLFLLVIAVLIRLFLCLLFKPVIGIDSSEYINLAKAILTGDFIEDTGMRTPVYPLFLAIIFRLSGIDNYSAVLIGQLFLGVIITLLIYCLFYNISNSKRLAFTIGLTYTLNPSMLLFEANILSEIITIFFICSSSLFIFKFIDNNKFTNLLCGAVFLSLLALSKPAYQFMPLLGVIFLILYFSAYKDIGINAKSLSIKISLIVLIPYTLLVGGWSVRNYVKFNYLGVSTQLGYALMGHACNFIEKAPDENDKYKEIKSIYLKNRLSAIKSLEETPSSPYSLSSVIRSKGGLLKEIFFGTYLPQAAWRSYPEMLDKLKISAPELSKILTKLSLELIINHPGEYFKTCTISFLNFWRAAVYAFGEYGNVNNLKYINPSVVLAYKFIFILLFGPLFFVTSLYYLRYIFKTKIDKLNAKIIFIYMIIIYTMLISTLITLGENARFRAVVEPLMFGVMILIGNNIIKKCSRAKI